MESADGVSSVWLLTCYKKGLLWYCGVMTFWVLDRNQMDCGQMLTWVLIKYYLLIRLSAAVRLEKTWNFEKKFLGFGVLMYTQDTKLQPRNS